MGARLRASVLLAIGLLASVPAVEAQVTGRPGRVGFLYFGSRDTGVGPERYAAFLEGMRELGYADGKNVVIEARFADSSAERVPGLIEELVRLKVDVVVATGSPVYRALRRQAPTLPVVVTVTADPLIEGMAAGVARPGGSFTGLTDTAADISPKQLELLRSLAPKLSRVGVLMNPDNGTHPRQTTRFILAGQKIGVHVRLAEASSVEGIEPGVAALARERVDAVILFGDTFFSQQLSQIAQAALKHRLPSVYTIREYAAVGGLLSYGANLTDNFRRAATYVDKILKGAQPGDLPFEQPTRYVLAVNLKTAQALGLTVPQSVLLQANSVYR